MFTYQQQPNGGKKSKQQRKKEARAAEEQAHLKMVADIKEQRLAGGNETATEAETRRLSEILHRKGYAIFDIPADGHCLYAALSDQLSRQGESLSVAELRKLAASYMAAHRDDFEPFIETENGESQPEAFDKLVYNIENTACWGGEMELGALAAALARPIRIFALNPDEHILGQDFDPNRELRVSFHRVLLATGCHYNSVILPSVSS